MKKSILSATVVVFSTLIFSAYTNQLMQHAHKTNLVKANLIHDGFKAPTNLTIGEKANLGQADGSSII